MDSDSQPVSSGESSKTGTTEPSALHLRRCLDEVEIEIDVRRMCSHDGLGRSRCHRSIFDAREYFPTRRPFCGGRVQLLRQTS